MTIWRLRFKGVTHGANGCCMPLCGVYEPGPLRSPKRQDLITCLTCIAVETKEHPWTKNA